MNKKITDSTVLCINRKGEDHEPHRGATVFAELFAKGCNGAVSSWEFAQPRVNPLCIRGMTFRQATAEVMAAGRTFYYIDNGYFGNGGTKNWFRVIKNHVHDIRSVIQRPLDRLEKCLKMNPEIPLKPFTKGRKIVVAPPSPKSLSIWNMDHQSWLDSTVEAIRRHTDRPIEIRLKRDRPDRLTVNTMEQAMDNDVHCLVTYNSVAAVEALMLGKPVFTLGPNAAGVLAKHNVAEIENPYVPTEDERLAWLAHLSYSQFNYDEISSGMAWETINQ